tara:strand:+ start:2227 stop:2877 length:651 start_codon:yes stop_codon:yes gene_type:complete
MLFNEILCQYYNIINKFIDYFKKNLKFEFKERFKDLILIRGINIIHYLYFLLLYRNNNLNTVVAICDKAGVYYIEFINHVNINESINFELNIRDAIIFMYKKTIFCNIEINKDMTILSNETTITVSDSSNNHNIITTKYISLSLHILNNIFIILNNNDCNYISSHIFDKIINALYNNIFDLENINNRIINILDNKLYSRLDEKSLENLLLRTIITL